MSKDIAILTQFAGGAFLAIWLVPFSFGDLPNYQELESLLFYIFGFGVAMVSWYVLRDDKKTIVTKEPIK